MQNFLKINENDNVVVALRAISAGECISTEVQGVVREIAALEEIPQGHKMAIQDIPEGGRVVKYGYAIGIAFRSVRAGEWIHTHNLKTGLGDLLEYTYEPVPEVPDAGNISRKSSGSQAESGSQEKGSQAESGSRAESVSQVEEASRAESVSQVEEASWAESASAREKNTFWGFPRPDNRAGVRNEIWVIPTVGCVNNVAEAIAGKANAYVKGSVEDVIAFSHPYGCSQMGEDQECTRRILADLIRHPNAGGVLVLGLGCENSSIQVLKSYLGEYDESRVRFLQAQDCEDEITEGLELIKELIEQASCLRRELVSIDKLVVGLKCGGSDGLSGITANPLTGRFSDRLIQEGGSTILTEVPEMFGAETILMNRCANRELFRQTVNMINDFKNYYKRHGQTIYENPSPGNKEGGISTLEDKSLGCTQKSGSAPVRGVLQYGERVSVPGLNLLCAPGNDLVAATALAAAGAQIILFTTGRGTPFASPVPTVKISTNSALAGKKANWIDFNAGVLVEGRGMEEQSEALFNYVLEVASGKRVCSEEAGFHDMAIFKQGVTL